MYITKSSNNRCIYLGPERFPTNPDDWASINEIVAAAQIMSEGAHGYGGHAMIVRHDTDVRGNPATSVKFGNTELVRFHGATAVTDLATGQTEFLMDFDAEEWESRPLAADMDEPDVAGPEIVVVKKENEPLYGV